MPLEFNYKYRVEFEGYAHYAGRFCRENGGRNRVFKILKVGTIDNLTYLDRRL